VHQSQIFLYQKEDIAFHYYLRLSSTNGNWEGITTGGPLFVHLIYQLGHIYSAITRLSRAHARKWLRQIAGQRNHFAAQRISPQRSKKRVSTHRQASKWIRNASLCVERSEGDGSRRSDEERCIFNGTMLHIEIIPLMDTNKDSFDKKAHIAKQINLDSNRYKFNSNCNLF